MQSKETETMAQSRDAAAWRAVRDAWERNDAAAWQAVRDAWERDPEYRARVMENPRGALAGKGLEMPAGVEVRVHANDDDTRYFVFPSDPNRDLSDTMLAAVHGGTPASSAITLGCAATAGTIPSCLSSAGSYSSASSAGSS